MRKTMLALIFCGFLASFTALSHAERVVLNSGDILIGEITARSEESITLNHPVLGEVVLPIDKVALVDDGQVEAEAEPTQPAEEAQAQAGNGNAAAGAGDAQAGAQAAAGKQPWLRKPDSMKNWKITLDAGVNGSTGNTENFDIVVGAQAVREVETMLTRFEVGYIRGQSGGMVDEHEAFAEAFNEWYFTDSRWSVFAKARYDDDEFEAWINRISATAGVGYLLIDRDKLNVRLRAGAGGRYDGGAIDEFSPEALFGGELEYLITSRQTLTASTEFYPALDDFGEFRNISKVEWKMALDEAAKLHLKIGAQNEYDSLPGPGSKNNDLMYYAKIGFTF